MNFPKNMLSLDVATFFKYFRSQALFLLACLAFHPAQLRDTNGQPGVGEALLSLQVVLRATGFSLKRMG